MHRTSNPIRVLPADGETIYRPLEKKAHETQTKPHFHMVYRPQEKLPNNEDSNYIRNPFTSPTFAKMLTSPTQNEIANSRRK